MSNKALIILINIINRTRPDTFFNNTGDQGGGSILKGVGGVLVFILLYCFICFNFHSSIFIFYNYKMHESMMYMRAFSMCAINVLSKCKHPFKTENVDKYQGHKEFLFLFSLGDFNII